MTGLKPGMYRYNPPGHMLEFVADGDMKAKLYRAAGQSAIQKAPAVLVIAGAKDRAKNESLMYLEAGHAAQNVYLQGVSLRMWRVGIGLPANQKVVYIMPIGKK